jgi:hypothetical protein
MTMSICKNLVKTMPACTYADMLLTHSPHRVSSPTYQHDFATAYQHIHQMITPTLATRREGGSRETSSCVLASSGEKTAKKVQVSQEIHRGDNTGPDNPHNSNSHSVSNCFNQCVSTQSVS